MKTQSSWQVIVKEYFAIVRQEMLDGGKMDVRNPRSAFYLKYFAPALLKTMTACWEESASWYENKTMDDCMTVVEEQPDRVVVEWTFESLRNRFVLVREEEGWRVQEDLHECGCHRIPEADDDACLARKPGTCYLCTDGACIMCDGKGACGICQGTGVTVLSHRSFNPLVWLRKLMNRFRAEPWAESKAPCTLCDGTGRCSTCGGDGKCQNCGGTHRCPDCADSDMPGWYSLYKTPETGESSYPGSAVGATPAESESRAFRRRL